MHVKQYSKESCSKMDGKFHFAAAFLQIKGKQGIILMQYTDYAAAHRRYETAAGVCQHHTLAAGNRHDCIDPVRRAYC